MSDTPRSAMAVFSAPEGGFYVSEHPMRPHDIGMIVASFTTLREAVIFLEREMSPKIELAQPFAPDPGAVMRVREA